MSNVVAIFVSNVVANAGNRRYTSTVRKWNRRRRKEKEKIYIKNERVSSKAPASCWSQVA